MLGSRSRVLRTSIAASMLAARAFVAGNAHADSSPVDAFAPARLALEEQRYDDAIAAVHEELASPRPKDRAPALEITATALLLEGRATEGAEYVHALFVLEPAFRLADPSLPPRVTEPFAAEAARPHARSVSISIRAGADERDYALELSQAATRVTLECRGGAGAFAPVATTNVMPLRARFALPTRATYGCFAVALDEDDLALGRLGDEANPVDVRPAPPQSQGVLTRWWFWTAVGAAVAGGVVLAYVETRPRDVPPPAAQLTANAAAFRFP